MSKINRRRFLKASSSAFGALVLAACGGGAETGGSGANTGGASTAAAGGATTAAAGGGAAQPAATAPAVSTAGKVQVVFWSAWGGKNGEGVQKLVDDFNASQPDIVVENQFQGTYDETAQKLAQGLQARQVPDMVALSEVTWNRFYINQSLQALDELFTTANFDPAAEYVEPLIKEGTRGGKIWWIPFARSTPLFYFNRDVFKQAGLPDRGPETWDELREWGPELMKVGGENMKVFAYATAKNFNAWHFHGNVWQWGGRYSDEELNALIDEAPAVEAGEWVRRFVHEDKMGYMADDHSVDFINGLCATTSQSTGSLGGILTGAKFQVGTAFLPQEKQFGCPTGGAGLALLASAPDDRKQAAVEFIKFLAKPENVAFWSKHSGYMPATKSANESADMQALFKENPNYKMAVDQLPMTQAQDTARRLIPNGDTTIGTGLERIIVNNEPAQQVFAAVAAQLEQDAQSVKDQIKNLPMS